MLFLRFCEAPASVAPYVWPDDITKWPICRYHHGDDGDDGDDGVDDVDNVDDDVDDGEWLFPSSLSSPLSSSSTPLSFLRQRRESSLFSRKKKEHADTPPSEAEHMVCEVPTNIFFLMLMLMLIIMLMLVLLMMVKRHIVCDVQTNNCNCSA